MVDGERQYILSHALTQRESTSKFIIVVWLCAQRIQCDTFIEYQQKNVNRQIVGASQSIYRRRRRQHKIMAAIAFRWFISRLCLFFDQFETISMPIFR